MITTQRLNSLPRKSNQPFTRNEPWTWWTGPSLAPRRRRGAVANRMNFARAPLQGLMSRTRSGRSTMAQKREQTHTSRPTQRRRPLHRWSETASTPSTGSGQRRTTPIYFGPRSQTLRRDFGMSTSRCRGSPQVPRALRGTPAAPACPPRPRGLIGAGGLWIGKGPLPGAEGPDRRPPFPPPFPGMECPGESGGEPLSWQPPTRGETFIILKADVTKAHRRIKVLPKDWKYQVACIQNRWWVNRVGTYGMASAQLYWGRKASLVLRLLYYIFPQVDCRLVFVDDYCWVLRCSRADWDATAILATLLALGVPLSWKKTALSPINTWLGFVVDPITPCVLLAPVKHVIILATLKRLAQGDIFTSKEVEQALGRIQWATSACPLTKPFLQPFWSWKKACTTSGRPPKLVRALAILLGRLFNQRFPLASPFAPTLPWTGASDAGAGRQADHAWVGGWCSDVPNPEKSRVKWFQHRITPEGEPWAFATGDPQRAIAALELFGLLLLVRAVLICAAGSASHTRILVASDNQGNVFSLLNDSTRRMPNAAILMEIVLTLHDQQVMLGPSHVKRDFNTWADELTHPDPHFPTENRVFPSVESELITLIFATFLPHP